MYACLLIYSLFLLLSFVQLYIFFNLKFEEKNAVILVTSRFAINNPLLHFLMEKPCMFLRKKAGFTKRQLLVVFIDENKKNKFNKILYRFFYRHYTEL